MNIEEEIERLSIAVAISKFETKDYPNCIVSKADLKALLTAYEKEKEEHKKECHNCDEYTAKLGELETENRMLKSELGKEKEKNKELENDFKDITKKYMEAESVKFWYNYIHKDKIRKMLQELEDRRNKQPVIGYWSKKAMLEKLLKEE